MTRRDWKDYSRDDVEKYIAHEHGFTLDRIIELGFPAPDYTTPDGDFWTFGTVYEWLGGFHRALFVSELVARENGGGQCDGS